jgi:hypothetical protein
MQYPRAPQNHVIFFAVLPGLAGSMFRCLRSGYFLGAIFPLR